MRLFDFHDEVIKAGFSPSAIVEEWEKEIKKTSQK